jgi:hypothetical protein
MSNTCQGCLQGEIYCSVSSCITKLRLKNNCPCKNCIVKMNCKDYCDSFRNYCFELSNRGGKDLTLLLMSNKSLHLFSRKTLINGKEKEL